MILLNGNIFVFGGTGFPFALTNSNQLYMYDLTKMRWYNLTQLTERQTFDRHPFNEVKVKQCGCRQIYDAAPTPKYGQSMTATSSHKLFIYSGTVGREFLDELHSFSLKTFRWTQYKLCSVHGASNSICRYRHEVILHQNQLLIFGGATMHDYYDFKYLNSFDFVQKRWTIIEVDSTVVDEDGEKVFPESRKAHCCVRYGDDVYMTGGIDSRNATYNDFWILSLKTNIWRRSSMVSKAKVKPSAVLRTLICTHKQLYFSLEEVNQPAHDVRKTLYGRSFNVLTTFIQHCSNVMYRLGTILSSRLNTRFIEMFYVLSIVSAISIKFLVFFLLESS